MVGSCTVGFKTLLFLISANVLTTVLGSKTDFTALHDDWHDTAWAGLQQRHTDVWENLHFDKLLDFLFRDIIASYSKTSSSSKNVTLPNGEWLHLQLTESNHLHQFVILEVSETSPAAIADDFTLPVLLFFQVHPWVGRENEMSVLKTGYKIQGTISNDDVFKQVKGVLSALIRSLHDTVRVSTGAYPCSNEFRTYSGTCNNAVSASWGACVVPLKRMDNGTLDPAFIPGTNNFPDDGMPNPRIISRALFQQEKSSPSKRKVTTIAVIWGQFIDHDVGLTPDSGHTVFEERMDISITDKSDPYYDRHGGTIEFARSRGTLDGKACCGNGIAERLPREQMNVQTSYVDASHIYGCQRERVTALRGWENGTLQTGEKWGNGEYLLPLNRIEEVGMKLQNAASDSVDHFVAGDVRANEQPMLTSLHTLFLREHNRVAALLRNKFVCWKEEKIFQYTRKVISCQIQLITYQYFLPAILGSKMGLSKYDGYKEDVDPTLANFFSTAAFRFGHSMVTDSLPLLTTGLNAHPRDGTPLHEVFFEPSFVKTVGIEPLLLGGSHQIAENVDTKVVNSLQNELFKNLTKGIDLVALNIQRGRDHGIPKYNDARELYGLKRKGSFQEVTANIQLQSSLAKLYGSVDEMDSFVGGLAEDHVEDSELGELFHMAIKEQFERLRDGDRFYYKSVTWPGELAALDPVREIVDETLRLQDIIIRNSGGMLKLEDFENNVFQKG